VRLLRNGFVRVLLFERIDKRYCSILMNTHACGSFISFRVACELDVLLLYVLQKNEIMKILVLLAVGQNITPPPYG